MQIKYSKSSLKILSKYDRPTREQILEAISGLEEEPPKGDIRPLSGRKDEIRLRTGKYRIIYEYILQDNKKYIKIKKIDSRGDVYKD